MDRRLTPYLINLESIIYKHQFQTEIDINDFHDISFNQFFSKRNSSLIILESRRVFLKSKVNLRYVQPNKNKQSLTFLGQLSDSCPRQPLSPFRSFLVILLSYKAQYQYHRMNEQIKKGTLQHKSPTFIFSLMILTNVLINLDHGILPACTVPMQDYYDMSEAELGILGSIVYAGISIMGMFAGRLYQKFNSKMLTVAALVVLELSLLVFVFIPNKIAAYATRFVTGVCQVFLLVYYPIWIDKHGGDNKTMWLTLLQICVPLGIFMGYGMTAIIISTGQSFKLSFFIQVGLVTIFIVAFLFLSTKKLDSRRRLSEELTDAMLEYAHDSLEEKDPRNKQKYKFSYMICRLAKSRMYLVGTFSMAVILYVSTGIQFWLTKYFIEVLGFEESSVFISYAVVSLTGPTTGCAFGGYVVSKKGGYENPTTVYYVFLFAAIGIGAAIIIPFVDEFYTITILLWIVLFFGGGMMPGLTGIMMVSVSPYLRAFGNSTGQIIKNAFGYFPSPFVYGLLNTLINERAGIKFLMFWGLWAPILLGYGSIHKYRQLKKKRQAIEKKNADGAAEQIAQYSDMESSEQIEAVPQPQERSISGQNPELKDKNREPAHAIDKSPIITGEQGQVAGSNGSQSGLGDGMDRKD